VGDCPVSPENLARLVVMIGDGRISGKIGKTVFTEMYKTGRDPETIVREQGLEVVSDENALLPLIEQVMAENPHQVEEYRQGREKLLGYFVGRVMKMTKGQADPKTVNQLLKDKLKG
jgi:aspartyl-tRNA(Asn)/glutamyl-tRNA(Gln) amidotransferase subunit B